MDIYRLLAISYSFVVGGAVLVEALLRFLKRSEKKELEKKDRKISKPLFEAIDLSKKEEKQ